RPPRPAPHPDVGELFRGAPPAEGFPAARPLQPRRADPAGALQRAREALLDGRAFDGRGEALPPRRHEGEALVATRTVNYELGTTGVDASGNPMRLPLGVGAEPEV